MEVRALQEELEGQMGDCSFFYPHYTILHPASGGQADDDGKNAAQCVVLMPDGVAVGVCLPQGYCIVTRGGENNPASVGKALLPSESEPALTDFIFNPEDCQFFPTINALLKSNSTAYAEAHVEYVNAKLAAAFG
jgi:hypothetical protein